MMLIKDMNAGGHNHIRGGYFYHTVKNIDIGLKEPLLIIQEMHNAETGKIVRQSVGYGMLCQLQYTTYQNRDARGRFKKQIEFFGIKRFS
jgi:hypothetical protein